MIKNFRRFVAPAVIATAVVLSPGAFPASAAEPAVELHCSGPDLNGVVAVDCAPATKEKPANQDCKSLKNSDDPAVAGLLGLLGVTVSPGTGIGVTCLPHKPAQG